MHYNQIHRQWQERPRRLLVTGAAGFIGSHLVEGLLQMGQYVVGFDNFATGRRENLESVRLSVGPEWKNFSFHELDVRDPGACRRACEGIDVVLHQAALGSVPRSIEEPRATLETNVDGFVNMLEASREQGVNSFVYASSASVYGDTADIPKREPVLGRPLSPYAASKRMNEVCADAYASTYGMKIVGLRYFNVFGPRQDPAGPYAAVIPRWLAALVRGRVPVVFGDGETSRDFCPVANVVQVNVLSAEASDQAAGRTYNIALGCRTTLLELFQCLRERLRESGCSDLPERPQLEDFRPGDVRHSTADISAARELLGYDPQVSFAEGIARTVEWALEHTVNLNRSMPE